jgi:hypothetical protein
VERASRAEEPRVRRQRGENHRKVTWVEGVKSKEERASVQVSDKGKKECFDRQRIEEKKRRWEQKTKRQAKGPASKVAVRPWAAEVSNASTGLRHTDHPLPTNNPPR